MASLFSKLFGQATTMPTPTPAPQQKRSSVGSYIAMHEIGKPVWTARTGTALTQAGYRQNPVVYRCVRLIAEAAASVAINVFEAQSEHESHPVSDLLARPNPREAGSQFFESLYGYLLLNGNAYLECVSVGNQPRELYALRPDRMKVIPGIDGWPEAYEYTVGADKHVFHQDERQPPILHLKLFDPLDDHYGMAPLSAGQMALDTHNVAGSWNKALLDNSARPSGALVYANDGANMSDTQFDRLKEELENAFQGSMNAGRPILLEGGLDWKPLSMSPKDMDFMEAKGMAAREIALAFGVPPLLLGLPGDNTYANYAEANRAFWRQSVLPLLNRTFGSLAHWLAPSFGDEFRLEPDLDRIEALSTERAALWARVDSASFLDRNEKRQAVGYGATEGDEADIAIVDMADEAGVDDPEAEINKLKARLYDLEQKYPGQPRDHGRFSFGRGATSDPSPSSNIGSPKPANSGNTQIAFTPTQGIYQPSMNDASPQNAILSGDEANIKPQLVQLVGDAQYTVDIQEEDARGGHIKKHVGITDEQLKAGLSKMQIKGVFIDIVRANYGSFHTQESANDFLNQTLKLNSDRVDKVANGTVKEDFIIQRFGYETGKEAHRDKNDPFIYMRKTYEVGVGIYHDRRSPRGYSVYTAYPYNQRVKLGE